MSHRAALLVSGGAVVASASAKSDDLVDASSALELPGAEKLGDEETSPLVRDIAPYSVNRV